KANTTTIKSLVIQSSNLSEKPHEITGQLLMKGNLISIIDFVCSCKAGTSECCKHVVAVLLHLNRLLGYSPDGVVLDNLTNTPIKLIEIKCPFKGKTLRSLDLLN
ncbi:SWIM-type domain-containing protein, partial [Aphis craccivora]